MGSRVRAQINHFQKKNINSVIKHLQKVPKLGIIISVVSTRPRLVLTTLEVYKFNQNYQGGYLND